MAAHSAVADIRQKADKLGLAMNAGLFKYAL
jgi:hypothetical protein